LLYQKYSSPMDLMRLYMRRGRFGEFVTEVINAENKRRQEEAERENEMRLWIAYCHSYSKDSYADWKKAVSGSGSARGGRDAALDDDGIRAIIAGVFPEKKRGE